MVRFYLLHLALLLFSGHASAQDTDGGSDMYGESYRWDPTMTILMIVLVSIFFTLGFLSIYFRMWLERVMGMNNPHSIDAGGNWLSLSRPQALGLEASVIETFPTFQYSSLKTLKISKEAFECSVCLNEFEDAEILRLVPKCCHVFHPGCIDAWLRSHATCPLCRTNLIPVPGESVVLTCNQNMPRGSMSTEWNLTGIFTTGQHEGNLDRFTLSLPQDIYNKLLDPSLSKSHVTFPQMMSSARGYRRTESVDIDVNYIYYERFDQDRPLSMSPPYRTCSMNSPLDWFFLVKNNTGECSSDNLRSVHSSPSVDQVV